MKKLILACAALALLASCAPGHGPGHGWRGGWNCAGPAWSGGPDPDGSTGQVTP